MAYSMQAAKENNLCLLCLIDQTTWWIKVKKAILDLKVSVVCWVLSQWLQRYGLTAGNLRCILMRHLILTAS